MRCTRHTPCWWYSPAQTDTGAAPERWPPNPHPSSRPASGTARPAAFAQSRIPAKRSGTVPRYRNNSRASSCCRRRFRRRARSSAVPRRKNRRHPVRWWTGPPAARSAGSPDRRCSAACLRRCPSASRRRRLPPDPLTNAPAHSSDETRRGRPVCLPARRAENRRTRPSRRAVFRFRSGRKVEPPR